MNDINEDSEFDFTLDTVPAPMPSDNPASQLVFALQEIGVVFPEVPAAVDVIENALDIAGDNRGADCLAHMIARLDGSAAGEALRRVVFGSDEPLRDAAARVGSSHVAIFKQEKRIREKLGLTAEPLLETDNIL